jgi:hypothetical protein
MKKISAWVGLLGFTAFFSLPPLSAAQPDPNPLKIQVESVVMGTDGQMRVRINGQYLTRHSEKDGVKVVDMDYQQVKVEVMGQQMTLKPHQTLTLERHDPAK